ncbi:MAG: bifunctional tetrahydrofolate synthase/dihydrofolate synthase [Methylococcales bacterium]|nr:bifunctional tetrahydrofolate synthase/dihydrofolate synthase [Methylococcales bacterium]
MKRFDSLKSWLDWQENLHPIAIDLGLERVTTVYNALNPDRIKPLTITVAGTNGKGSCVAYLEAMYRAQGYSVGTYSSPHILKYNERIKINGEPVSDDLICDAFSKIEAVRDEISLSYFEFGTLAALTIFQQANLDIQLLEVGLGGRLDAVNIVEPDIALITSIDIDHVDWLGATREAIGKEKSGIFRSHKPAIVGDINPPDTLLQIAKDKQAELYLIKQNFNYSKQKDVWTWSTETQSINDIPTPGLKGEHQYRNASSAILAVNLLAQKLPVDNESIRSGIKNVHLLGRFQLINDKIPVLLDVGHNPEAVRTLVDYLTESFPDKKIHAVFSMMRDKDIAHVLELMNPIIYDWFFSPLNNPRTASEAMMREFFAQSSISRVSFGFKSFNDAFLAAQSKSEANDLLLVFGSFFLVSECLNEFKKSELTK